MIAAAFEEEIEGRVVQMVRALNGSGATRVSLVAVEDGVVGHVQLSRAWIDARARLVDALMLTPLAVRPDRQRLGIGKELVARALGAADALGAAAVFLEGDPAYYSHRGFSSAASLGFLRPSLRIPKPGFQVATLAAYEASMTGQVVYPQAIWEADCVGLRDPQLAGVEAAMAQLPES